MTKTDEAITRCKIRRIELGIVLNPNNYMIFKKDPTRIERRNRVMKEL